MGPPCTTRHLETFNLEVVFTHNGLEEGDLEQSAGATAIKGALSLVPFEIPWATLPSAACKHLTKTDKYVDCNGKPGTSLLHLPVLVESFFPANTYKVNYYLASKGERIACASVILRICQEDKC